MADLYVADDKNIKEEEGKEELKSIHKLPGHSHNPLAAYYYKPDNVHLETQEKDEKVVLFLRQHPIVNIPWILIAIGLIFAPTLFTWFPLLSFLPDRFQFAFLLLWYLITTAFVLEKALSWFFNVYVLTDERILDVDFYNLIYREVSDAKIDKIQDVTYKMGGVTSAIFNYGSVYIQTAGTLPNFEFLAVPNPASVAKVLQELRTQEEIEAVEGRIR